MKELAPAFAKSPEELTNDIQMLQPRQCLEAYCNLPAVYYSDSEELFHGTTWQGLIGIAVESNGVFREAPGAMSHKYGEAVYLSDAKTALESYAVEEDVADDCNERLKVVRKVTVNTANRLCKFTRNARPQHLYKSVDVALVSVLFFASFKKKRSAPSAGEGNFRAVVLHPRKSGPSSPHTGQCNVYAQRARQREVPCDELFAFRLDGLQVKVTEDIRLDRLGQLLLEMIDKDPKGLIRRPTQTISPGSCPICRLAVDGDEYFICVCCLSPIHERCSMKCPCVESHL